MITWAYEDNDILQLTVDGTNYELQLAGVLLEFYGTYTSDSSAVYRLRLHSNPKANFTATSGYTKFPDSAIVEYWCNGSTYTPTWNFVSDMKRVKQEAVEASSYTYYRPLIFGFYNSSTASGYSPTTQFNQVYATSSLYCQPSSGSIYATTFHGALDGNADTATTATNANKVYTTTTTTTAETASYALLFAASPSTSQNSDVKKNNGLCLNSTTGTAGTAGKSELVLGNSTASTGNYNKKGVLSIYSTNTAGTSLVAASGTSWATDTLPNRTGTVALEDRTSANILINALDTGSSTPVDNDYYIAQWVNGGTTTTDFVRRKTSALFDYMKNKMSSNLYLDDTGNTTISNKAIPNYARFLRIWVKDTSGAKAVFEIGVQTGAYSAIFQNDPQQQAAITPVITPLTFEVTSGSSSGTISLTMKVGTTIMVKTSGNTSASRTVKFIRVDVGV